MTLTEKVEPEVRHCGRCSRASRHLIKSNSPDNQTRYICWSCCSREEKGVNLNPAWKRWRRPRRD